MIILCCLDFRCLVAPFWAQRRVRVNFLSLRQKSHLSVSFPRKTGCRRQFNSMKTAVKNLIWAAIYSQSQISSTVFFLHFFGVRVRLEERYLSFNIAYGPAQKWSRNFASLTCGILSFRRPVGNEFFFAEMKRHTQKNYYDEISCARTWMNLVFTRLLSAAEGFPNWDELK